MARQILPLAQPTAYQSFSYLYKQSVAIAGDPLLFKDGRAGPYLDFPHRPSGSLDKVLLCNGHLFFVKFITSFGHHLSRGSHRLRRLTVGAKVDGEP